MTEVQGVTPGGSNAVSSAGGGDAEASRIAEENQVSYVPGEHKFQVVIDGEPTDISPLEAVCLVLQQRYITMSDITAQKTREMQEQIDQINEANAWLNAIGNAGDGGGSPTPPGNAGDGESSTPSAGAFPGLAQWMTDHGLPGDGGGSSTPSAGTLASLAQWMDGHDPAGDGAGSFTPPAGASTGLTEWMADHGLDTEGVEDNPDADGLKKAEGEISNYVDQLCSTNDLKMLSLKTAVNKTQEALTAADGVLQDLKQLMQTITANMAR